MRFDHRNKDDPPPGGTPAMPRRPGAADAADAGVRSAEAALRILEVLAQHAGPVRVTDLAHALSLGKPRVCRHLATLESMGLARRVGRQGYSFGDRMTRMARCVLRQRSLSEMARPALQALRDKVGQTVTLSVPMPDGAVVLDCLDSGQSEAIRVTAGTVLRYPYSPAARLARALEGGGVHQQARQVPALPLPAGQQEVVASALARWRGCGADYEIDTQGTGLGGLAAPVFSGPALVGMVSIVMSSRLLMPVPPQRLFQALGQCVCEIQEALQ